MNYLDFFSDSPKTYIFQKSANKTKFGGFLFIIYMFIMAFISIAYILDYTYNDKYAVEYSRILNSSLLTPNNKYDPKVDIDLEISFKFRILDYDWNTLPDEENFVIHFREAPIKQNEFVKSKLHNFYNLKIYYKCEEKKCEPQIKTNRYFTLEIEYSGFELYHQNDTYPPLQMNENKTFIYRTKFNFYYSSSIFLYWEAVKYKEENGVSKIFNLTNKGDKYDYIGGYISSSSWILNDDEKNNEDNYVKLLARVNLIMFNTGYTEYKRKRKSVLDVISKIGALFSTIRVFFLYSLKYYSKNFDNYKVIEKILNKDNIVLKNENKKKDFPLMKDISDNANDNKLLINDNINQDEDFNPIDIENENKNLSKFSFFDFYFNNIYCEKFHTIKQDIINLFNEISSNYFSVETILYNQIRLENLFKDYKWNNSSLNSIENNELIIRLKNLFNS